VRHTSEDAIGDAELVELLVRTYVAAGFTDADRATALFAPQAVRSRGDILHIRDAQKRLLGMVILVPYSSSGCVFARAGECELHLLATAPESRNRGIGRALVGAAKDEARRAGYARMLLWTQPTMHAAQRLYQSLGFVRFPQRDFEQQGRPFLFFQAPLVAAQDK
jgi:ribosomal protein S18 acetylase RimI-like enzyme